MTDPLSDRRKQENSFEPSGFKRVSLGGEGGICYGAPRLHALFNFPPSIQKSAGRGFCPSRRFGRSGGICYGAPRLHALGLNNPPPAACPRCLRTVALFKSPHLSKNLRVGLLPVPQIWRRRWDLEPNFGAGTVGFPFPARLLAPRPTVASLRCVFSPHRFRQTQRGILRCPFGFGGAYDALIELVITF